MADYFLAFLVVLGVLSCGGYGRELARCRCSVGAGVSILMMVGSFVVALVALLAMAGGWL